MIDRLFTAALTFALLAGATVAFGAEFVHTRRAAAMPVYKLERVVIVGKRQPASAPLARADAVQPAAQRVQ